MEKSRACYGARHICCTHYRRWSIWLSSTTLRIHGLSYESRRKSWIQPLSWIRPVISGYHTQWVATPQNYQPPNLAETRLYVGTKMATLTLQILGRGYKTAHRRRSLWPDLWCRTWYQCGSSMRACQTRWSHQTTVHTRCQGSEWRGWSQPHTPTKHPSGTMVVYLWGGGRQERQQRQTDSYGRAPWGGGVRASPGALGRPRSGAGRWGNGAGTLAAP